MSNIHDGHRERMRQQYKQNGSSCFLPHQIVEMLLFYAIPRKDTNELAHRLLHTYRTIPGVFRASYESLCSVPGMTENAALFFRLLSDVIRLCSLPERNATEVLDSADKVRAFIKPQFIGKTNEQILLLCLNAKNQLLFNDFVSEGSTSAAELHVQPIMEKALANQATAVILAHNHPSGSARPSPEDRHVTKILCATLGSIGIKLLDHFVVSDDDCVSIRSLSGGEALFELNNRHLEYPPPVHYLDEEGLDI